MEQEISDCLHARHLVNTQLYQLTSKQLLEVEIFIKKTFDVSSMKHERLR